MTKNITIYKNDKQKSLPDALQVEMLKFFLKTSIPRKKRAEAAV